MAYISDVNMAGLLPVDVSAEILKETPEQSVVMRLGKRLPNMAAGTEKIPVLSVLPLAYFVSGTPGDGVTDSMKKTTNLEWADKYLYAEEIACIVPIPEKNLKDTRFDIWGEAKPAIIEAIGQVFDAAVLYGTNKPTNWPNGIYTDAIAKSMRKVVSADLYEDLLGETGVISLVEGNGYFPTGHVSSLSMRGKLRGLKDLDDHPIFMPSMQGAGQYDLDGSRIDFPLNGCVDDSKSLLITGAWNKLVYSIREDIAYKILTEAVIQDPVTKAIVYNLAQQDMVALRVTFRIAWQIPNPVNRINTNNATRYPFAVLTPTSA